MPRAGLRPASGDRLRVAPGVASLGEQLVRRHRAPGAGRVEFLRVERAAGPGLADGIDNAPGGLDLVAPDEEGGVAGDGLQQQTLVGFGRVGAELGVVAEVHPHRSYLHAGAGYLAVEAKGDSFVGL